MYRRIIGQELGGIEIEENEKDITAEEEFLFKMEEI